MKKGLYTPSMFPTVLVMIISFGLVTPFFYQFLLKQSVEQLAASIATVISTIFTLTLLFILNDKGWV